MGNQHSQSSSSDGNGHRHHRVSVPFRSGHALGLSKADLDKRCQPSGLYASCEWETKAIRKLVGDGKLAARMKGSETKVLPKTSGNTTTGKAEKSAIECPICFLYYRQVNMTKCCHAHICTECYLQVRPQNQKASPCPYCNAPKLSVHIATTSNEEIAAEDQEQKRIMEAKKKAEQRLKEEQSQQLLQETAPPVSSSSKSNAGGSESSNNDNNGGNGGDDDGGNKENSDIATRNRSKSFGGFGSSLQQDDRVAEIMRKRSESFASSDASASNIVNGASADDSLIQAIAMSSEDRRKLENQMKAQHNHPLTLRLQAEAAERTLQNQRNYYTTQQGQHTALRNSLGRHRRMMLGGTGRDWFSVVDAYESSGERSIQSLDDLILLEAAIVVSMEEAQQDGESEEDFDAAQHARDGFPLVRRFLERHINGGAASASSSTDDPLQQLSRRMNISGSGGGLRFGVGSGRRNRTAGRHSTPLIFGSRGLFSSSSMSSTASSSSNSAALDAASMLLRGITEEEQMAMAIAASLQESQSSEGQQITTTEGSSEAAATESS